MLEGRRPRRDAPGSDSRGGGGPSPRCGVLLLRAVIVGPHLLAPRPRRRERPPRLREGPGRPAGAGLIVNLRRHRPPRRPRPNRRRVIVDGRPADAPGRRGRRPASSVTLGKARTGLVPPVSDARCSAASTRHSERTADLPGGVRVRRFRAWPRTSRSAPGPCHPDGRRPAWASSSSPNDGDQEPYCNRFPAVGPPRDSYFNQAGAPGDHRLGRARARGDPGDPHGRPVGLPDASSS